jgi:hypothetical protein
MDDQLKLINSISWAHELERRAERWRLGQAANSNGRLHPREHSPSVVIRASRAEDAAALQWLAERDGAHVPENSGFLVAEVDGAVLAALPIDGGQPIADPFRATAHLVEMLELRARHLRDSASSRRGLRVGLRHLLRGWARPAAAPPIPANVPVFMRRDGQ